MTAKSKVMQKFMSPIKGKPDTHKSLTITTDSPSRFNDQRDISLPSRFSDHRNISPRGMSPSKLTPRGMSPIKSHSVSPRARSLRNPRDVSRGLSRNPRDISRNVRDINVNLSRLRVSSDASSSSSRELSSPRRLLNTPQRIKPRVTQTQWTMQNNLGRSEKDYIDKLSTVV